MTYASALVIINVVYNTFLQEPPLVSQVSILWSPNNQNPLPNTLHHYTDPFPSCFLIIATTLFRQKRPYSREIDQALPVLDEYSPPTNQKKQKLIIHNLKERKKHRENYPCSGCPYLVNVESAFPGELGLELVASIFALSIVEHRQIQHDTLIERHFHAAIFELDAEISGCFMQPLRDEALADAAICALWPCRDI